MIITIDGPAGAGKSTVAQRLARRLGFRYLESGCIYRALTFKLLQQAPNSLTNRDLIRLVKSSRIGLKPVGSKLRVFLDGKDVTRKLRAPVITNNVYRIAENPEVRQSLIKFQRRFGKPGNLIAEGRDMGSIIFPKAGLKFYLDASLEARARRRYQELLNQHCRIRLTRVISEIRARDKRDRLRKVAPLVKPKEAIYIDTTKLNINQALTRLLRYAHSTR